MRVLLFHVGAQRYAVPCRQIVEVLPLVELRLLPRASLSLAGLFTYQGEVVPVIDLAAAMLGTACPERLSTRLLVVDVVDEGEKRRLALMVERVTETMSVDLAELFASGVKVPEAPYLGEMFVAGALVQIVAPDGLLGDEVRALWRSEATG